jgi:transposase
MKERSRVEQFERIRRDGRDEELSIRGLSVRHRVHRRTVRAALADAVPPARKVPVRARPVSGPWMDTIRGWLEADLSVPRKQRHTARRVWQRLLDEKGVRVSESTIRALVHDLKIEIGADRSLVTVPQTHEAGRDAEVDFGDFVAVIAGERLVLHLFVMRLSHSGKAVHIAYGNVAQEAFLDGHVRSFEMFGGVPTGQIRYDNLKPAVLRVLLGRERLEHPGFVALRSHYGFDSFYCLPGVEGAHEKGGVEGEIGRFRRRHLTPVPVAASLAALNEQLAAADARDDYRRIAARTETVREAAAREAPLLNPLPGNVFEASSALSCRVDAKARICVRQSYYSVPARLAGKRVHVTLGADWIAVRHHGALVARHTRSLHKGTETLELDHYLEVLGHRPGAFAGATALVTARASGAFTAAHQRFWDAARRQVGDRDGTRALIGVLLLHRTLPRPAVLAGIDAALTAGRCDPDLVAVEARRHQDSTRRAASAPVTSPTATVPVDQRPPPTLHGYDDLLEAGA